MGSSTLFILWCLTVLEIIPNSVSGLNIRELPIRLRVLEFDGQTDRLVQVLTSRNSDLIVGDAFGSDNRFILECKSSLGPMAFTYRGDGIPEYRTYANITRQGSTYWTFLTFSRFPKAEDTGNYTCQSMSNSRLSNSVYLYVPGSTRAVFVPSESANRLDFSRSEGSIRIPCSVVHPDAIVSLERVSDRSTARAKVQDRVSYDPKFGFKVPMTVVRPGSSMRFVCRGEYNGRVEETSYQLFSEESSTNPLGHAFPESRISKPSGGLISPCTKSTCGKFAECLVIEYNPHCVCYEDYTGDPKLGCHKINEHSGQLTVQDRCDLNPCGPFSKCLNVNGHPVCSCLENYYGTPPRCKPHRADFCTSSSDCEWEEYCNQETRKCENVCKGSIQFCSVNARCLVINHTPFCECLTGFRGNPYITNDESGCKEPTAHSNQRVCDPSSCGLNAVCKIHRDFPTPLCFCPDGFTGDASTVCFKIRSPENLTLPTRQPFRAQAMCEQTSCGINGKCSIQNNQIQCSCPVGFRGDPLVKCVSEVNELDHAKLCSVCGPSSICKISRNKDKLLCECAPGTVGNPPNCTKLRNFCRDDFDCPDHKVCDRNKCLSPCSWSCSDTAICKVFNHTTKCSCPQGYEGDARYSCKKSEIDVSNHPCRINCGPNSVCRQVPFEELQQYRDSLRASRHDALYFDMVKANGKLRSGMFSECFCRSGFDGNPYSIAGCQKVDHDTGYSVIVMQPDPCKPRSPCGNNSICRSFNGKAFCSCESTSTGQPPYCKLRCISDKDCMFNETCINKICEDS